MIYIISQHISYHSIYHIITYIISYHTIPYHITSYIIYHISYIIYHISYIIYHISYLISYHVRQGLKLSKSKRMGQIFFCNLTWQGTFHCLRFSGPVPTTHRDLWYDDRISQSLERPAQILHTCKCIW